jgi:hypothetical protein
MLQGQVISLGIRLGWGFGSGGDLARELRYPIMQPDRPRESSERLHAVRNRIGMSLEGGSWKQEATQRHKTRTGAKFHGSIRLGGFVSNSALSPRMSKGTIVWR